MDYFRYKDSSNVYVHLNWEEPAETMPYNEYTASVLDLQTSLTRMTEERNHWKNVARMVAKIASSSPQTVYGRTVEYILDYAEKQV